ncbi:hypothetical protein TNCV_4216501 [Trichonephila clavipes]|nr:hypothetical protein TNCV_4216501 [Trichonephila clavipes]
MPSCKSFSHYEVFPGAPRGGRSTAHSLSRGVSSYCGVPGNVKADTLACHADSFSHPKSFYSIKNLIKRSIKARTQEDLYNRVSHKFWRNAILNLRNSPRRRIPPSHRT